MTFTRFAHGMFWGMVATVLVAVFPLVALALGAWPLGKPVSVAFVEKLFRLSNSGAAAYLLAGIGQLVYGALWGAFLAYVARPSSLWGGVGVGMLRWGIASWMILPYLDLHLFGLGGGFGLTLAVALTCGTFGGLTGYFLHRDEIGEPVRLPQLHLPLAVHVRRRRARR
jgi:hypothetical protein